MFKIKSLFVLISLILVVIVAGLFVYDSSAVNAKANNEKVRQLLKEEYEYDLTRLLVVRKNSDKPEVVVIEDVDSDEGYISSRQLREKNKDLAKNQDRLKKLESKMIELMNDENIEHVQPDYLYTNEVWGRNGELDTPDDFDLTPSASTGNHWYYEKSNLRSLWYEQDCFNSGVGCGGSSDVVVAVIDTGLAFQDYNDSAWIDVNDTPYDFDPAPDMFVGDSINLWTNSGETPNDDIDNDGNGFIDDYHGVNMENYFYCDTWGCTTQESGETGHPDDDGGHGTFVTGLIASLTGNGSDSVSPAHNVSIMTIKANYTKTPSFGSSRLVESINYAVDNGADIINMSLAGSSYDALLEQAVNNAHESGVLIIASSGNSGGSVYYPAKYVNVVAVGAVKADDTKTFYSAYGPELDLVAYVGNGSGQGDATYQESYSCFTAGTNCYNSTDLTRYKQFSNQYAIGTSFAAPQVAAAAAIILGNNLAMSPDELSLALATSTNDINTEGRDDSTGTGVLDFMKAGTYVLGSLKRDFFSEYIVQDSTRLSWLITANPSTTEELYYINKIGGQAFGPYILQPNERKSVKYVDLSVNNKGPVEVISNFNSYTTQVSKIGDSYYQVHGIDLSSLSLEYFYPEYIVSSVRKSWILVGNPSDTTTEVMINIGGEEKGPFEILPGARISKLFTDLSPTNRGPVQVVAGSNIYSSQISSIYDTYNQIQGIKPANLTNEYFYPEYIVGTGRNSWLLVGNPSETLTANVTINIGGEVRGPYPIPPGGNISKIFYDLQTGNRGPVKITSDQNIYSSQIGSIDGAFYQMVGLESTTLKDNYFYPEYIVENGRLSWLIFSNPSTTEEITLTVKIGGITKNPVVVPPNGNSSKIYFDLGSENKGPVEISSANVFYTIQINKIGTSFYLVPGM